MLCSLYAILKMMKNKVHSMSFYRKSQNTTQKKKANRKRKKMLTASPFAAKAQRNSFFK